MSETIHLIGRWTGLVTFALLLLDIAMMELFRYRKEHLKDWLGSRVYANRFHGIISATLLATALLHGMLLMFGQWQDHAEWPGFPFWVDAGETYGLMIDLGTIAAGLMLLLALHGLFRKAWYDRFSYRSWRRVHLTTSLILIVVVAVHAVTVGEDLRFLGLTVL